MVETRRLLRPDVSVVEERDAVDAVPTGISLAGISVSIPLDAENFGSSLHFTQLVQSKHAPVANEKRHSLNFKLRIPR